MFEQVKRIFIEELGLHSEDVTPEANLRNGLGISSLEFLNVIIAMEDAFAVTMDPERLAKLKTVNDVVLYVEKLKT